MDSTDKHERSAGRPDADVTMVTPGKRSKSESLVTPTDMTKAEPFPKGVLPMENKYNGEKYFVRECYAQYYGVAMDLLRTKDGVSVTGTPGIGTSICMAYFFQRLSREHPSVTIKMVSYGRSSVVKQAVKTRGGKVIESDDVITSKAVIWLLDGTPTMIPDDVHWVSFTTPDESWMKQLAKSRSSCAKVFMPVWTLGELREAALVLNRSELLEQISDDELRVFGVDPSDMDATVPRPTVLDYRFAVFGGVPRWCFAEDSEWLVDPIGWLRSELCGLSLDAVRHDYSANVVKSPSVLHYFPEKRSIRSATARVASTAIELYLAEREQSIAESKPTAFEQGVLRGAPWMETILAFSMAVRLYRRLQLHCTAEATRLGQEGDKYLLLDNLHGSNMHWLNSSFETTPFCDGEPQWTTPFGSSLLSSNSFCWMPGPGRVMFFQVTASMQYPVDASGYSKVLKAFGLWEAAQQSPHSVAALVFVVPKWNKDTFQAQPIYSRPLLDDPSPVSVIAGLTDETVSGLAKLEIHTVGHLRVFTASNERLSKTECKLVSHVQAKLQQIESGEGGVGAFQDETRVIERIPQYAWGI